MTAAVVKVNAQQISTGAEIFGESLIGRFIAFAGVKPASRVTYTKSLRQMFRYFNVNGIVNPTRENLVVWIKAMAGDKLNDDENAPTWLIDGTRNKDGKPSATFGKVHYDGEVAADGDVYRIVGDKKRDRVLTFMKGNKVIGKSKAASTIQLYCAAAKIFFRWTAQDGLYPNIADHLKPGITVSKNHKKDALSTKQCKELVKSVKGNSVKELRDSSILNLMSTAGLRTIEIVRANVGDIRFERGKVFLAVQGKGRDEADEKVLLSKQTYKAITAYLKARGKVADNDPLFTSTSNRNKNGRLDTQSIRKMVKKNLRGIGLDSPRLSAHSLRHAVVSNLIDLGVDLPTIQIVTRHKSIATLMIYDDAHRRYNNNSEQILADEIFKE